MIERDCFEMFELLRIWSISQYLAAPFSHCKAMIDNMVHNSGPYFIWYAPLSLAYSVSSSVLPLYTSTMYTPLLPLPLFCLCTLPPCTLLFFLFLCFASVHFHHVHSSSSSSSVLPLYPSTMYTPLLPLPLFCLCTLPPCTLLFFLSAADPDRLLDVHPLSEFVTLVLSSVYICFPIEGSWDAPLSYRAFFC